MHTMNVSTLRRVASWTALTIGVLNIAACGVTSTAAQEPAPNDPVAISEKDDTSYGKRQRAWLIDGTGEHIGSAIAWQGRTGVVVQVEAKNLQSGTHGLHLHATGSYEDIGVFKHSGGHIVNAGGPHGFLHPPAPARRRFA